ncbi:MAG: SoxR reducing system RseC family protein [Bacteroidales bacterium]|nr:SoxR reducing system RseC family protein [Bacteroidales bacterium]
MGENVSHIGKIVRITPQVTTVSILQHAACGECHAAGLCGMADLAEKTVEVPTDPYAFRNVGDQVEVLLKASMGMKAVWLCYAIPLVILLGTVLGLMALGAPEIPAASAGLGAIGLYYIGLYLFRNKLRNEYVFTIK